MVEWLEESSAGTLADNCSYTMKELDSSVKFSVADLDPEIDLLAVSDEMIQKMNRRIEQQIVGARLTTYGANVVKDRRRALIKYGAE